MGGDDSQKLLLWRGAYSSPGRKPPAHYEFNTVTENCRRDLARATSPASQPRYVAQLQTAWVIFGKQTWVTSPARRRMATIRCRKVCRCGDDSVPISSAPRVRIAC